MNFILKQFVKLKNNDVNLGLLALVSKTLRRKRPKTEVENYKLLAKFTVPLQIHIQKSKAHLDFMDAPTYTHSPKESLK